MSEANQSIRTGEQINHQLKDWKPVKGIYTGLTAFNLLSYLYLLVTGAGIDNMPIVIWITRLVSVPLAIYLGKLWRNKGFQILTGYFLLLVLRCVIPNPGDLFSEEVSQSVLSALWVFASCYGLGSILSRKEIKSFLLIIAGCWTLGMTIISSIGIYAAWVEHVITIFGKGTINPFSSSRLNLFYYATTSGAILGISALIALILVICLKKTYRILAVVGLAVILCALALTDSRTAFICVSVGSTILILIRVLPELLKVIHIKTKWLQWVCVLFVAVGVFVVILLGLLQITPLFLQLRESGIIPKASAEEIWDPTLVTRGFSQMDLSGRTGLWKDICSYIRHNPKILLWGASKYKPLGIVANNYYAHCHCLYIQVLMESGIPGLLLFLSFIVYSLIHSKQAISNPGLPLWLRLLPAIPVALWIGDLADCFTWLRASQCPMIAILFITVGIICAQTSYKKPDNKSLAV